MHSYHHHIKDFNNATRHLTRVERSLYRDAIELYYETEQPLPADDFDRLARRLMAFSQEEKESLQFVLDEFFELTGNVYSQNRCDEEIEKYREAKKNHWGRILTREQRCEIEARRRASKLSATPQWLSPEHEQQIKAAYLESKEITAKTGIPHEVDHIIPLSGASVCGLHVPWNLQVIPAFENRRKSNLVLEGL